MKIFWRFRPFKTDLLLKYSNLMFKLLRAFKCKLCVSTNKQETINCKKSALKTQM